MRLAPVVAEVATDEILEKLIPFFWDSPALRPPSRRGCHLANASGIGLALCCPILKFVPRTFIWYSTFFVIEPVIKKKQLNYVGYVLSLLSMIW